MSRATREFFENLKDGVNGIAPGLGNLVPDVKAELSRLGTQGAMELASALFNGHSFVPYGPGQYTPTPGHDKGVHGHDAQRSQQEQEQERGGREM